MGIDMEPGARASEASRAGEETTEERFLQVHQPVYTCNPISVTPFARNAEAVRNHMHMQLPGPFLLVFLLTMPAHFASREV